MREVSCRVFSLIKLAEERHGLSRNRLQAVIGREWSYLADPTNRIDWSEFVAALKELESHLPSERDLFELARDAAFKDTQRYNGLASILTSMPEIYEKAIALLLQSGYSAAGYSVERLDKEKLRLTVTIPEPYEECRGFLVAAAGVFSRAPALLGLPDADVAIELHPRRGVYVVTPPKERHPVSKILLLPKMALSAVSMFRFLRDHTKQLTDGMLQLEHEAKNFRAVIEFSGDAIAVTRDGVILHCNRAFAALTRVASTRSLLGSRLQSHLENPEMLESATGSVLREAKIRNGTTKPGIAELLPPTTIDWEQSPAKLWLFRDVTEKRALENALAEARQREQANLARDLHDGLGQHLTALAYKLKAMETRLEHMNSPEVATAKELVHMATAATGHARDIAHGMAPMEIDNLGLMPALEHLASAISRSLGVACEIRPGDIKGDVPRKVANHLFRIAQEAITNAHRHGRASRIQISFHSRTDQLLLAIDDNGPGFPATEQTSEGMGLKIMRHRARTINGSCLFLRSAILGGARIEISVPLHPGLRDNAQLGRNSLPPSTQ